MFKIIFVIIVSTKCLQKFHCKFYFLPDGSCGVCPSLHTARCGSSTWWGVALQRLLCRAWGLVVIGRGAQSHDKRPDRKGQAFGYLSYCGYGTADHLLQLRYASEKAGVREY